MSSWYSSWLSGLPAFDFAVPSSIQRRFFSFLLKRTLGHFLKPGQLNLHQIDSQLGSGTVQVKDLELDGQAINQLLVGLPVSLYDGFISGVTARIPFPNPLSSSVGLQVQSLNLTFQITPEHPLSPHSPPSHNSSNLADSVVSVAETFVHDELTPREEASLRQSLRPSAADSSPLEDEGENLPGGFNPFGYNLHIEASKQLHGDNDPAGVSIFATLIERLLAKFEFSAVDTKVTIISPEQASFTLSIPELTYHATSDPCSETDNGQSVSEENSRCGQTRTVSISGLKVTSRDLRVIASPTTVTTTLSPASPTSSRKSSPLHANPEVDQLSRNSSTSSLDEDIQLMMSQSIAILPPTSSSLLSTSCSMYQSAISTALPPPAKVDPSASLLKSQVANNIDDVPRGRPFPRISVPRREFAEDVLLSFGSQPIVFSLRTPSRHMQPHDQVPLVDGDHKVNPEDFVQDKLEQDILQFSVVVGTIACAFRSDHFRVLLDVVDAFVSKPSPSTLSLASRKEASPENFRVALSLEVDVTIRGVVMLTLPEKARENAYFLDAFYERPHVPPRLPYTYLRLFLDALSVSSGSTTSAPGISVKVDQSPYAKVVISDISLFAFHAVFSADDPQVAAPVLITDHHLPTLHVTRHHRPSLDLEKPEDIKLPEFQVIDWTQAKFKNNSAKPSTWRFKGRTIPGKDEKSRTPSQRHGDLPSSPNPFTCNPLSELEDKPVPPAIEVFGRLSQPFQPKEYPWFVEAKMAPLHLFFDLGMIFNENLLLHFVKDIASATIFMPRKAKHAVESRSPIGSRKDDLEDVQFQQMAFRARERDAERRRLEALVLEDFNMDMGPANQKSTRQRSVLPKRKKTAPSNPSVTLRLTCPIVRVEVRCSSPLRPPRSGCMLFNIRGLVISNDTPSVKYPIRFSEESKLSKHYLSDNNSNVVLSIYLQEILGAYSAVGDNWAHTIFALGSLPTQGVGPDTSALLATEIMPDTLRLSVVLRRLTVATQSPGGSSNKLITAIDIPLVNLVMDKALLDGIQYWADDVAQLIERSFAAPDKTTEAHLSHNASLIGSRYFTQTRSRTRSTDQSIWETSDPQTTSETIVKVRIMEVLFRFIVPRNDPSLHTQPLDIHALDVNALIELSPEGKDECLVTAEVMDIRIADTSNEGDYMPLVQSSAQSVLSAPRPSLRSRIKSSVVPEATTKESQIKITLWGFTVYPPVDGGFVNDLAVFAKAPPGVFESVVPSERTRLTINVVDVSVQVRTREHPGAVVLHLGDAESSTELVGNSSESAFKLSVTSLHILLVDSIQDALGSAITSQGPLHRGVEFWRNSGYALIAEISHFRLTFRADNTVLPPNINADIERIDLRVHICADTISALTGLIINITRSSRDDADAGHSLPASTTPNTVVSDRGHDMTASLDEHAFRLIPEVGSTADMISDDLPANQEYLDASFGTAAGLREIRDDDFEDFEEQTSHNTPIMGQLGIVSNVGGETVRILRPFSFIEHYFDMIPPDSSRNSDSDTTLRLRIHDSNLVLSLHDGFDWPRTRKIIEKEVKEMRKKLARIRQLVATGQTQEPIDEAISTTLFNSFHVGLEQDLESMDPATLIAAIDDALDDATETGTESSWQSLHPASPGRPRTVSPHMHGKRLTRSKRPSIEIRLEGLSAEVDNYRPGETLVSRTLIVVKDIEILDHIKTSTWKKFLTDMRSDSRGNVRETDSNMARVELLSVRPSPSSSSEEARLRAKILPLRLYVDQDALDFFKKFFAFQDPDSASAAEDGQKQDIYFQHAEVFPVDIKLDYKPRRVDYKALRDGRTIELMNFFHFDAAEMTLRHLTLHGITGWPRFFDTLNDLWTPDVKATQLVDVISGVAPIRSVVNVGSGVADLILLPIAQYKKDGRIVRGLQKGTKAFVQSTAMEAIKLGARLATGTQVILEQAENVLGGQFKDSVTAEALQIPYESEYGEDLEEDLISRYATQPVGLREGVRSAYRSLQRNFHSAAQTILAVPMEVYERSGNEGAVRAVVRAVPIAVLKPMIGASEAVSKTLLGLHNSLDPNVRLENEAKYKCR